jgi:hypothetical protein
LLELAGGHQQDLAVYQFLHRIMKRRFNGISGNKAQMSKTMVFEVMPLARLQSLALFISCLDFPVPVFT